MSLIDDVKSLLSSVSSSIWLDTMPDQPDNIVALFHSGGGGSQHILEQKGVVWENPTFQVRVRHAVALTAVQWAQSIKGILDGISNTVINAHTYLSVTSSGDIINLGKDDKARSEYSLNFICKVKF